MSPVDVFFTSEDAHKVRPLIHFLTLHELALRECDCEVQDISSPYLVIVSEHMPDAAWLDALLDSPDAIAVLISHAEVPAQIRTIDLRAWPARSADRTLASFAEWMKADQATPSPFMAKQPPKHNSGSNAQRQNFIAVALVVALFAGVMLIGDQSPQEAETDAQPAPPTAAAPAQPATQVGDAPVKENDPTAGTPDSSASSPTAGSSFRSSARPSIYGSAIQAQLQHRACLERWALNGQFQQCWNPLTGQASWLAPPEVPPAA